MKHYFYYISYVYTTDDKPEQTFGGGEASTVQPITRGEHVIAIAEGIAHYGGFKTLSIVSYTFMREEDVMPFGRTMN